MSRKPATRTEEALLIAVCVFGLLLGMSFTWSNPRFVSVLLGINLWAIIIIAAALILQDRKRP